MEESGPGEIALYEALLDEPRQPVAAGELDAVEDADARANLKVWLEFRERLLAADSLEACYRGLFDADVRTPPLFIDQLVQIILRSVLDGVDDPLEVRAGELFYREQKVSIDEGRILLADLETVEMHASGRHLRQPRAPDRRSPDPGQGGEPRRARYGQRRALLAPRPAARPRHQPQLRARRDRRARPRHRPLGAALLRRRSDGDAAPPDPGREMGVAHRARCAGHGGAERSVARAGGRSGAARAPARAVPDGLSPTRPCCGRTSPASRSTSRSRWTRRTSSA